MKDYPLLNKNPQEKFLVTVNQTVNAPLCLNLFENSGGLC